MSPFKEAVQGLELPLIEEVSKELTPEALVRDPATMDLSELEAVPGFAAYPLGWFPRAGLLGLMPWDLEEAKAAWDSSMEDYDPEDPDDKEILDAMAGQELPLMQQGWSQEAHPSLQVEAIRGDEEIRLENLTPDGVLFFRLPGRHPIASLGMGSGHERLEMRLDTLTLDLMDDREVCVDLVWRGWRKIRDYSELESASEIDVVIDEVEQDAWVELQQSVAVVSSGGTAVLEAMDADDEQVVVLGEEAEIRYKEQIHSASSADEEDADEQGGLALAEGQELQVTDNQWDEKIRAEKTDFEQEAEERAKKAKAKQAKAIKKKARKKADEEFAPDDDKKKKKKKKKKK